MAVTPGQRAVFTPTVQKAVGFEVGTSVGTGGADGGEGAGSVGAPVGCGLIVGVTGIAGQPAARRPSQSILHSSPKLQQPIKTPSQKLLGFERMKIENVAMSMKQSNQLDDLLKQLTNTRIPLVGSVNPLNLHREKYSLS